MSKTSQRRRSMYQQGYNDYKKGYGFRWDKHPMLAVYKKGFNAAIQEAKDKRV